MRAFVLTCAALGLASSALQAQTMDDHIYTYVAFDELEYAGGLDERPVSFDAQAWIGGDYNRLWLKTRGEHATRTGEGGFQVEALFSRTVAAFWNAQAGVALDRAYGHVGGGATRALLGLGVEGLAPYWFEVESFVYVSHEGDVSLRLDASYDLLLTQRLIVEPEVEFHVAVQEVPDFGVATGLNDVELGARMRYEIVPELAPYVGVTWLRRVGGAADLARRAGEPAGETALVAGLRWWY